MSAAVKLLADFHAQGVGVQLEGGSVKVTAPKGAVTDAQAATLRRCKAEIVRLLSDAANDQALFEERAAIIEYDGNLPRAEAERMAREQMLEAPPAAEYAGFDWGPSDPFKRFRQRPTLLRSTRGAS
jgi:hypothetical protein